jgi:DNA polymerase-3 subunit delta'
MQADATSPASSIADADPRRAVTLDRVLGNDPIRDYLRRAWSRRQLPAAMLLSGPDGIGKMTLAWALARQVAAGDGDPATDPHALKVERGVHPDMMLICPPNAASSIIPIDSVRQIEDRVWTPPLEAERKIVLIEPADHMNKGAANCLLKLLEEPPSYLIFILITSSPASLLDTIRSRCAAMTLEPVAVDALADWLVARGKADPPKARLVARLAEGRPGHALALCEARVLGRRAELLRLLGRLREEGFAALFGVADGTLDLADDLGDALRMGVALLRDALALRVGGDQILNLDLRAELEALAGKASAEGLMEAAQMMDAAAREAAFFYVPQARAHAVEVLLADVGRALRG